MRKLETRSFDMGTMQNAVSGCSSQSKLVGEFFNKLSPQALKDLGAMVFSSSYPAGMILFSEKDPAPGVYIVLDGWPSPDSADCQEGRYPGARLRALRQTVRDDSGDAISSEGRAHLAAGFCQLSHAPSRGLPDRDRGVEPRLRHGLRATPHRGVIQFGA